ncbi:MAG: DUF3987 domain-containing protein [Synergistaceae bacterium]|jgi:hypothetical protein|nr:DUF3987 domain-containing protein [Synergistaceae bacterium]
MALYKDLLNSAATTGKISSVELTGIGNNPYVKDACAVTSSNSPQRNGTAIHQQGQPSDIAQPTVFPQQTGNGQPGSPLLTNNMSLQPVGFHFNSPSMDVHYGLQQMKTANDMMRTLNLNATLTQRFRNRLEKSNLSNIVADTRQELGKKFIIPLSTVKKVSKEMSEKYLLPEISDMADALVNNTKFPKYLGLIALLDGVAAGTRGHALAELSDGRTVPAITQTLMVAESGTRKTAVIERVKAPFLTFQLEKQREYADKYGIAASSWEEALAIVTRTSGEDRKKYLHDATLAELAGCPGEISNFVQEQAKYRSIILAAIPKPTGMPLVFVGGGSLQQLGDVLNANDGCSFECQDEGDIFVDTLARKNGGGCLSLVLKGYDGTDFFYFVRKSQVFIPHARFYFLMFVQPCVFDRVARAKDFGGRGGLARFSILWPDLLPGYNQMPTDRDHNAMTGYNVLIKRLLERFYTQCGDVGNVVLKLAGQSEKLFDHYAGKIEASKGHNVLPDMLRYLEKHADRALRYAIAAHFARCREAKSGDLISAADMLVGIAVADMLLAHAEFAFGLRGVNAIEMARKIVRWINGILADKRIWHFTRADVHHGVRGLDGNNIGPAVDILQRLNVVFRIVCGGTEYFVINPLAQVPGFNL